MKIKPKVRIHYKTLLLFKSLLHYAAPAELLKISQWAERERMIPKDDSAEPGKWNPDRAPYQKEMMDAASDIHTERVVFMTSAQIGKTFVMLTIMGYYIDRDPSPILFILPTKDIAEPFSKDRLAPMIRDTPVLAKKIGDAKSRSSDNTIFHKRFPGGQMNIIGANAPAPLSSKPIKIILADELDRFPESAGDEGDPLTLAVKRTETFWDKKIIVASTPTVKGHSRIEREYENSTMERWCVPCPRCGYDQPLEFSRIKFPDTEYPDPAMLCACCDERISEKEWRDQYSRGKWIPRKASQIRGFHLNELSSPWKSWGKIIEEFKEAKSGGLQTLKAWINTALGESWEDHGSGAEEQELYDRREKYDAELPKGVLLLTCGIDVQDNRLELEVVGWNRNYESWGIEYVKLFGDMSKDEVWGRLEEYLQKEFCFLDGTKLSIAAACIDTGGHFTDEVYRFCKKIKIRNTKIIGIKGMGSDGNPFVGKSSTNNKAKIPIHLLGVNAGKESLLLRIQTKEVGPGYCHFPSNSGRGYDKLYFSGLTSEYKTETKIRGRFQYRWVVKPGRRNEPFDIRNYATAALEIISPINWEALENSLAKGENYMTRLKRKRRTGAINSGIEV